MQEQSGHTIGPYRIESVLGRGGMGVVYAVRHPGSPALLALKTLEATAPLDTRLRFRREIELLSQVDHPHVLKLLDTGQAEDGRVYLVTELVPGQDLREQCKGAPLSPQRALHVMRALSEAVGALHAQGILHRDLKPENVILRPNGSPVLLDFGIARADEVARLTKTGEILGTPAFMSPEQVDGQGVDERADVYGLAAILFYLLSGHAPFTGKTAFALYRQVLFEEPEWPTEEQTVAEPQYDSEATAWSFADDDAPLDARELRANLWEVCRRGMAKDVDVRYPSARAFAGALEGLAHGGRAERAPRKKRPWALVAAIVFGLVFCAWGLVELLREEQQSAAPTPPVAAAAVVPNWESEALAGLPPLSHPRFRSLLGAVELKSPSDEAAVARLTEAFSALDSWRTASDTDLEAWATSTADLPQRTLGPLSLLRPPSVTVFHHGSHLPPPTWENKLDNHLEDNAIQVAFVDAAGTRFVTVGNRMLKLWRWPTKLVRSVQLPKSWALTLCVVVQPSHERVFLGGRVLIAESKSDPSDISKRACIAAYVLDESYVRVYTELASVFGRDRMHSLALHETTLVGGTNNGTLGVFRAKHKLELAGRGETSANVNARGIAFLDDPTRFFTVSGDDNDAKFVFESYRITDANCVPQEPKLVFEQPPGDHRVFTCLSACPPYGLYAGHGREGVVARYSLESERVEPLVDPRTGRAHFRSATSLASAREREWLVSASGWAEWEAHEADKIVHDGKLPGEPATLCIWDLKTSTLLGRYAQLHELDGFSSVAITPDGSRVLAGTAFGDVLGWDLE